MIWFLDGLGKVVREKVALGCGLTDNNFHPCLKIIHVSIQLQLRRPLAFLSPNAHAAFCCWFSLSHAFKNRNHNRSCKGPETGKWKKVNIQKASPSFRAVHSFMWEIFGEYDRDELRCGFLKQLVLCKKRKNCGLLVLKLNMRRGWRFNVKHRKNGRSLVVPPPPPFFKKNPGSAPDGASRSSMHEITRP